MISIICDCCGKKIAAEEEYVVVSAAGCSHDGIDEERFTVLYRRKLCRNCYGESYDKYLTRYKREGGRQ